MVMRIGGLASGIDTEQMVRDMMRLERMKVDRYFRQEEALKWKQEALNTTNKTLADFILKSRSDFGLTRTTSTGVVFQNSTQNFDWVKKISSSDESVIKATASATAMEGTHKIKVGQLADVANVMSADLKDVLENNRFDVPNGQTSFTITTATGEAKIKLKDTQIIGKEITDFDFSGENALTFLINGKEVILNEDTEVNNIEELVAHIQTAIEGTGITVGNDGNKLKFASKGEIVIESLDMDSDGSLNLETKLGLENGLYKAQNSINDVVKQINNAVGEDGKNLGVRAAYDANLGKLMITTKEQGKDQFIKIENTELTKAIFGDGSTVFGADGVTGKDAKVEFNGGVVEQSSNNFSMFGVNYQLQSLGTATINVESDVDGIFNKVTQFVEDYNELIDNLNGLLKEESYRDYQPLTREEKEVMKEKEIELWEEKAKSGLLKNDPTISRTLQNMRSGLYMEVEGLEGFNQITQIGITTGRYQDGGKLQIDEEKLRKAIIEDSEGVMNLLFKNSDVKVPNLGKNPTSAQINERNKALADKRANSGLVERLYDDIIVGMKDIVRRSGTGEDASTFRKVQSNMLIDFVTGGSISTLDRDITNMNKRLIREEARIVKRENQYWAQFTAMEKAFNNMNQQSMWLMSQMGMM